MIRGPLCVHNRKICKEKSHDLEVTSLMVMRSIKLCAGKGRLISLALLMGWAEFLEKPHPPWDSLET
jgi:hypothetical protein